MSERLATTAPASVRLAGVLIYVLALTYLLGLILAAFGFTAGGVWLAQREDERATGLGAICKALDCQPGDLLTHHPD
jgi:hypothetical protein